MDLMVRDTMGRKLFDSKGKRNPIEEFAISQSHSKLKESYEIEIYKLCGF